MRLFVLCALLLLAPPAWAAPADDVHEALQAMVARCWAPPSGALGVVTVHLFLAPDGQLAKPPVVSGLANAGVAKAALHAVEFCAPYRLVPSRYSDWKSISVTLAAGQ